LDTEPATLDNGTRVAVFDDPLFDEHDAGPGHPERPARLTAIREGIAGLLPRLVPRAPVDATREQLLRVHTEEHVATVLASAGQRVRFDPDTLAGPRSAAAAVRAAGAVVGAVDQVLDRHLERALCLVRPPGHHAEADRAMGFCLFNNVAVGAAHALARGLQRVLVIDFDVHHGNGTQAIFYADPRVLYLSSHEFPFYPGTGDRDEVGAGAGTGYTVNLPLPPGMGDAEYLALYREIALPIARQFAPELLLVSVGFDPHADDPLAGMRVSAEGFAGLAALCLDAAGGAPSVFVLEGGYDLAALRASAAALTAVLLGDAAPDQPATPRPGFEPLLAAFRTALGAHWSALG
jgi:acetoin utilization deacetylase AcuC-like enzyme